MRNINLVFILFFFIVIMVGCSSVDDQLEEDFRVKLLNFRDNLSYSKCKIIYFDLRSIFGDKWEEVCLQFPLESKRRFEDSVGKRVNGFERIRKENDLALWVFYINGASRRVKIPQLMHMNLQSRITARCTKLSNPYIYATSPYADFVCHFYLIGDKR